MPSWDKKVVEIIQPNSEDENGDYWDPWESLGLHCCGYNSEVDQNAINVLRGIRDGLYNSDIAKLTGMSPPHVELLQSIFCSANWCEYGTSPRGCFPIDREGFPALTMAWESYYERHWGEPAQGIEAATADETVQQGSVHESPVAASDAPVLSRSTKSGGEG